MLLILKQKPVIIDIEQYFEFTDSQEIIYRKSEISGKTKYTKITKIDTDINKERIIKKKNISEEEYTENIKEQKPIKKKRYCFSYLNQYFRLDIFDDGLKMLEIEETNKTGARKIPAFITVEDEVTTDVDYRNASLYNKKNSKEKQNKKKC